MSSSSSEEFVLAGQRSGSFEFALRQQVAGAVQDLVADVEAWWYENVSRTLQFKLQQERLRAQGLEQQLQQLQQEKTRVEESMDSQRSRAASVRDVFLKDVCLQLRQVALVAQLKEKLGEADKKLQAASKAQRELKLAKKRIQELERWREGGFVGGSGARGAGAAGGAAGGTGPGSGGEGAAPLENMSDKVLLKLFRYMTPPEVMAARQLSRTMFKRIDAIFEIGSNLAHLSQRGRGGAGSTPRGMPTGDSTSPAAAAAAAAAGGEKEGSAGLTSAMAEQLTRKLTNVEMKAILAMTDKLRKQSSLINQLKTEKEDLVTRLQGVEKVKDFLASSLHEKEVELKQVCEELRVLQQQRASDHASIAFLDEQVLQCTEELEEGKRTERHLRQMLDLEKTNNMQQMTRLQNALEGLKAEKEAIEAKAKLDRRKLAKEVRLLRTQLNDSQAERDEYKAHLDLLMNTLNVIRPRSNSGASHHSAQPTHHKSQSIDV